MRRLAALTVIGSLAWAAPALGADPTFEPALEPDPVVFGGASPSVRLKIRTGGEAERFGVRVVPPGDGFVDFAGRSVGTLLALDGSPRLEGPGELTGQSFVAAAQAICTRSALPASRGAGFVSTTIGLELPAEAETTLVVPLRASSSAPWPGARYEVVLAASESPSGETTLDAREIAIPRASARPAGRSGVRLSLDADPPGDRCNAPENPGRPITLRGRSDPPLRGESVILRYAVGEDRSSEVQTLATVPVADDGTFEYRDWRPKQTGRYEVGVLYRSGRAELTDDFAAPTTFTLTAPVPDPPGPPDPPAPPGPSDATGPSLPPGPIVEFVPSVPVLVDRTLRVGRDGLVRLRLDCPAAARVDCGGELRLRVRGRTAASRRVFVARGARRAFRVRLSRSARRRVVTQREVAVTVRIGDGPARSVTLRRR